MIYLHMTFRMPSSNISLVTMMKPKCKEIFLHCRCSVILHYVAVAN
jgi:hypothetical protein